MAGNRSWMMARKVRVTRRQVELAQAKVEADRRPRPDPLLVKIAAAGEQEDRRRLAG